MKGVEFELEKLLRRKELAVVVRTSVDDRRFGVGGSKKEIAVGTVGCGDGVLLVFKRVELTGLFGGEIVDETRREEVAAAVVALMEGDFLLVFSFKSGGLECLLTTWAIHRFKYIKN